MAESTVEGNVHDVGDSNVDELWQLIQKSGGSKPFKHESRSRYLRRITTLRLQGKKLEGLVNLGPCQALRVVYLYNNAIRKVPELSRLRNLTKVYLENNKLTTTRDFQHLVNLEKLYLDGNCISCVSHLEQCVRLEELRLNEQKLSPGTELSFEEETLIGLADNLAILHVSGNRINLLAPYALLLNLKHFVARSNAVDSLPEIQYLLHGCTLLEELDLRDNPVSQLRGYRDFTILNSEVMMIMDGKSVPNNQRDFLRARDSRRALARSREGRSLSARSISEHSLGSKTSYNSSVFSASSKAQSTSTSRHRKDDMQSISSFRSAGAPSNNRTRRNNNEDEDLSSLTVLGFRT